MRRISLVVATLTLNSLNGLAAQDGGVSQLKPGKTIRMSIRGGATYEGRLLDLRGDTLVVGQTDDWFLVPVRNVDSLWVRGNAAKTGAIVGAIPVALLGALTGGFLSSLCRGYYGERQQLRAMQGLAPVEGGDGCLPGGIAAALGGLIGASVGAPLGAIVGALIPKWRQWDPPKGLRVSLVPHGHRRFGFNASVSF